MNMHVITAFYAVIIACIRRIVKHILAHYEVIRAGR